MGNAVFCCYRNKQRFFCCLSHCSNIFAQTYFSSDNKIDSCVVTQLVGKIFAQRHTVKQICFPNGNVLFLSLVFSIQELNA